MTRGRVLLTGLLVVACLSVLNLSSCATVLFGCSYAMTVRDSSGHFRVYVCDRGVMLAVPVAGVPERET